LEANAVKNEAKKWCWPWEEVEFLPDGTCQFPGSIVWFAAAANPLKPDEYSEGFYCHVGESRNLYLAYVFPDRSTAIIQWNPPLNEKQAEKIYCILARDIIKLGRSPTAPGMAQITTEGLYKILKIAGRKRVENLRQWLASEIKNRNKSNL